MPHYSNIKQRNAQRKRNYDKTSYNKYHKERWDGHQEWLVLYSIMTDSQLSKMLGRSVQAIQQKRLRLNKGE